MNKNFDNCNKELGQMNQNKINASLWLTVAVACLTVWNSAAIGQDEEWGQLKGRIVIQGDLPEIEPEKVDKDREACMVNGKIPLDDNLLIDKKSRGLKDAFVMMYLKKGSPTPPIHPSYEEDAKNPIEIDNNRCRFVPHAAFARTGQPVRLKNSDEVGHNCHITLFNSEINLNLPIGEHIDVKFDKTEKIPGQVKCDMHSWMDSVLLVRDEPYVAITDKDGKFEIKNVPAGEWKFQFWHKKAGYMRDLEIPDKKVGRRGEVELVFENGKTIDLGELKFDSGEFKK